MYINVLCCGNALTFFKLRLRHNILVDSITIVILLQNKALMEKGGHSAIPGETG